jgi:PIN domain nuclease of toxin-antitoxin system
MRILLDTHVLIWAVGASGRLDVETAEALADTANDILFSAASIWEIAIKYRLGRPDFLHEPREIVHAAIDIGFTELPVYSHAAAVVATLPLIHRDPFDRLLIAQALAEPAILYTADTQLPAYSDLVRRVDAS